MFNRARGPDTFRPFVLGYFLNARKACRAAHRKRVGGLDGADVPQPESDDVGTLTNDELTTLDHCLKRLQEVKPRDYRAVALRYLEERSGRETARALGVTETNGYRIVHNGLRRLRDCIRESLPRVARRPAVTGTSGIAGHQQ